MGLGEVPLPCVQVPQADHARVIAARNLRPTWLAVSVWAQHVVPSQPAVSASGQDTQHLYNKLAAASDLGSASQSVLAGIRADAMMQGATPRDAHLRLLPFMWGRTTSKMVLSRAPMRGALCTAECSDTHLCSHTAGLCTCATAIIRSSPEHTRSWRSSLADAAVHCK